MSLLANSGMWGTTCATESAHIDWQGGRQYFYLSSDSYLEDVGSQVKA